MIGLKFGVYFQRTGLAPDTASWRSYSSSESRMCVMCSNWNVLHLFLEMAPVLSKEMLVIHSLPNFAIWSSLVGKGISISLSQLDLLQCVCTVCALISIAAFFRLPWKKLELIWSIHQYSRVPTQD